MPLNLEDNEDNSERRQPSQRPILHQPGEVKQGLSKGVIVLFIIVVLGAVTFLVHKFGILGGNNHPQAIVTKPVENLTTANSESALAAPPQVESLSEPEESEEVQAAAHTGAGKYTIYIARYKSKATADEEASRWNEVGYETTVTEYDGWYRVSIGRFKTWDEAKAVAEKLSDGLEAGYHIGKIIE